MRGWGGQAADAGQEGLGGAESRRGAAGWVERGPRGGGLSETGDPSSPGLIRGYR